MIKMISQPPYAAILYSVIFRFRFDAPFSEENVEFPVSGDG